MNSSDQNLVDLLLMLGDDRLILGHRISEWCGHAPVLEEDIAMANIALDLVGQASLFLKAAATLEGQGRDEDKLAFLRDARQFRNVCLVEQPNGDFGVTIARQFLFDAFSVPLLETLAASSNAEVAALAAKSLKEDIYHLRHSQEWVLRLGDGTEESARRIQSAFNDLWHLCGELFVWPASVQALVKAGTIPDLSGVRAKWDATVNATLKEAKLTRPSDSPAIEGGRVGTHSEHLGHLLAEMQVLPRTHPGATW
ncbi:MAG: phenylacetate-CoA oxygenase subunit PaaI [Proteobacteria bacterium]|nr:phenylacetate-CoA oxygenase subunit PaaI [Pseudomonadota bacterium]